MFLTIADCHPTVPVEMFCLFRVSSNRHGPVVEGKAVRGFVCREFSRFMALILVLSLFHACDDNTLPMESFTNVDPGWYSPQELAFDAYLSAEEPHACKILFPVHGTLEEDPNQSLVHFRNLERAELLENGNVIREWKLPMQFEETFSPAVDYESRRRLECKGYNATGRLVAYDRVDFTPLSPLAMHPGHLVGSMWISYYYLAIESDYEGPPSIPLYDRQCRLIAYVSYNFAREVCIEGSGMLLDGTRINYAGRCDCAFPCPLGGRICYMEIQNPEAVWGLGSRNNPLVPFRSLAVDNRVIPYGATLYMPEWDGVFIPLMDGIGGFVHDGCFRADDVGGAIRNDHFDFFSGTRSMWLLLERRFRTRSRFHVYMDAARCRYLAR